MDYLSDILMLLAAAIIAVPLFQFLKLGAIPGFLVAGVVLGPSGLAYIEDNQMITHLAELGVVLLLFIIGMEINPSRLWKMRRLVLGLGTLQVLVTGGILTVLIQSLLGLSWKVSLLVGLALSLSSTAFVLQLLTEKKLLYSGYGRPAVAILLMQDLAVVPLLALVSLMAVPELTIAEDVFFALGEALAILMLIIVFARYVLNPVLKILVRHGVPEIFTASALLLVLGSAMLMEHIGLSSAMGAFIAGLLIADSSYRHQIGAEIQPFRGLLLGLFFMSMGMKLDLSTFLQQPAGLLAGVVGLLVIKCVSLWMLSRLFGLAGKISWSLAVLLSQSGEFALVLFAVAKTAGLLDAEMFQYLLIVVLLSMLVTPLLDKLALRIAYGHQTTASDSRDIVPVESVDRSDRILIAGFGRMGHRIGYILEQVNLPYIAIDADAMLVERERAEGKPVYFGDAQRPEVLRLAGAADAPLVIVAIDDYDAAERVVAALHSAFPKVPVFARGHDLAKCRDLKMLGAYFTVSETLEASAELARSAMLYLGEQGENVDKALEKFRSDYYGRIETSQRVGQSD